MKVDGCSPNEQTQYSKHPSLKRLKEGTKMNQTEQFKLQTVDTGSVYQLLKKTMQFLIPISLFSLLLSCLSPVSFIHHSIIFYFKTFISPLFSHILERKYMFLFCNGILAFLASNLGLGFGPSQVGSDSTGSSELLKKDDGDYGDRSLASESSKTKTLAVDEEEEWSSNKEVYSRESGASVMEDEDIGEEREEIIPSITAAAAAAQKAEEDAEGKEELSNTDELNKKFEDFIRKMKEELKIEAQRQQLVAF